MLVCSLATRVLTGEHRIAIYGSSSSSESESGWPMDAKRYLSGTFTEMSMRSQAAWQSMLPSHHDDRRLMFMAALRF